MSEPISPQMSPYVEVTEAGKHAWCACGLSARQPFCDGSHKGSEFSPVIVQLAEKKSVAWCGCKKTSNPPYCDGTHNQL